MVIALHTHETNKSGAYHVMTRLRCYFGILGNYFFRTSGHPKTLGVGITRPVNKTFLDIIKRFSRYGRAFVGFTRVETHVSCYFSREIVFNAWLYCKKTPLFIDRTTIIIIKGDSKKNNGHSNGISEDQEPNLNESGVYIYY